MKRLNKLKEITLFLVSLLIVILIGKELCFVNRICCLIKLFLPVFIGFIYAWLFHPLLSYMSRKHKRNFICIFVFLFLLCIVFLFLYYLVPIVYREINELVQLFPKFMDVIREKCMYFGIYDSVDSVYHSVLTNAPSLLLKSVKSIFSSLGTIGIGLMLGLYLSMDYEKFIRFCYSLIPKSKKCVVISLLQKVSEIVRKSIYGTLIVAFLVCILDSIVFLLFKLDAVLLLGFFCGLTDLIPYVGPYIGGALAVLVALTESKQKAICVLIGCVLVQCIENYLLQPLVMSKSIEIHPIFIMIGVLVFGSLFGVIGMILATPIVATIKVILTYFEEAKRNCE